MNNMKRYLYILSLALVTFNCKPLMPSRENNIQFPPINIDSIELRLSSKIPYIEGDSDTVIINYSISHGEFASTNEGLIIFSELNQHKAKYVRYNKSSYGIPWDADTIIDFYKKNKNNYKTIKEWTLDNDHKDHIDNLLEEIKNFKPKCCSNASEHYVIFGQNYIWVKIDAVGQWNKYLEIKSFFQIE